MEAILKDRSAWSANEYSNPAFNHLEEPESPQMVPNGAASYLHVDRHRSDRSHPENLQPNQGSNIPFQSEGNRPEACNAPFVTSGDMVSGDSANNSSGLERPVTYARIEDDCDSVAGFSDDRVPTFERVHFLEGFENGESSDFDNLNPETYQHEDLYQNHLVETNHPINIRSVYLHKPGFSSQSISVPKEDENTYEYVSNNHAVQISGNFQSDRVSNDQNIIIDLTCPVSHHLNMCRGEQSGIKSCDQSLVSGPSTNDDYYEDGTSVPLDVDCGREPVLHNQNSSRIPQNNTSASFYDGIRLYAGDQGSYASVDEEPVYEEADDPSNANDNEPFYEEADSERLPAPTIDHKSSTDDYYEDGTSIPAEESHEYDYVSNAQVTLNSGEEPLRWDETSSVEAENPNIGPTTYYDDIHLFAANIDSDADVDAEYECVRDSDSTRRTSDLTKDGDLHHADQNSVASYETVDESDADMSSGGGGYDDINDHQEQTTDRIEESDSEYESFAGIVQTQTKGFDESFTETVGDKGTKNMQDCQDESHEHLKLNATQCDPFYDDVYLAPSVGK